MGLLGIPGKDMCKVIWRSSTEGAPRPPVAWFGHRFMEAASIVVDKWGPQWSQKRLGAGPPVGAWCLAGLWLGMATALAWWVASSMSTFGK